MKIMFYNIAYGTGLNGSWAQYFMHSWRFFWLSKSILKQMSQALKKEKPDVLCLAEVDGGSFRNRFQCQAKHLAKNLNFPFYHTQAKYLPWSVWRFMSMVRKQHDAVLSRKKGDFYQHTLHTGMKKLVQEYVVKGISVFTVHLAVLSAQVRQKQFGELADIVNQCPRPYLVCGDFNIYKGLGELKEFIRKTGLRRVTKEPTFPSFAPTAYLDMFFASPGLKIKRAGIIKIPYSDHLPIWVEIT